MDFLAESRDLVGHVGVEFPLRENPFMQPRPIDEEAECGESEEEAGDDSASDSGDDPSDDAKRSGHLSTWPRRGHSDHQNRIKWCRAYVLAAEDRHQRKRAEEQRAVRAATRALREKERAASLAAAAVERPWAFVDHNDPTGKKREQLKNAVRRVEKRIPRSESLPRIIRPGPVTRGR
jgi:hypothetical protein